MILSAKKFEAKAMPAACNLFGYVFIWIVKPSAKQYQLKCLHPIICCILRMLVHQSPCNLVSKLAGHDVWHNTRWVSPWDHTWTASAAAWASDLRCKFHVVNKHLSLVYIVFCRKGMCKQLSHKLRNESPMSESWKTTWCSMHCWCTLLTHDAQKCFLF